MLQRKGVPFFPDAAWRDVVASVVVIVAIVALAVGVGAPPLEKPPDPSSIQTTPRPDWYLLWIYALFALMPPEIESYAIVLAPPLVLFLLLALPFISNTGERSPIKRPWAIVGVASVVTIIAALLVTGFKAPWSPDFAARPLPADIVHGTETQAVEGGKLFYRKACEYCHSIDGHGGTAGPDLSAVARRMNAYEMRIRIVNGSDNMPAYGRSLSSNELEEIVAFLQTRK